MKQAKQVKGFARLEKLTAYDKRVSIYVPATKNGNEPIDNTEYVKETATLFSLLFGGATEYLTQGYYVSDEKGLIVEGTTKVESFTDEITDEAIDQIIDHCEYLKKELGQECVLLEVNGKHYFI